MVELESTRVAHEKSNQPERPEWSSGLSQACWDLAKCNAKDSKVLMTLGIANDYVENWWAPEMIKNIGEQCSKDSAKCSPADNKIVEKVGQAMIDHAFDEMKYNPDPSLWEYSKGKLTKAGEILDAKYGQDGALTQVELGKYSLKLEGNTLTVTETERHGSQSAEKLDVKGIHLEITENDYEGTKQKVANVIAESGDEMREKYGSGPRALVAQATLWTSPERLALIKRESELENNQH